jgi:hypothetical protein
MKIREKKFNLNRDIAERYSVLQVHCPSLYVYRNGENCILCRVRVEMEMHELNENTSNGN